jgi:hypothetical protein
LGATLHRGLFKQNRIQVPEEAQSGSCYQSQYLSLLPSDILCDKLSVKNTEYRAGMLVVTAVSSQDKITAGVIKKIVVRGEHVFFFLLSKICVRQKLRYFRCIEGESKLELKRQEDLRSFKPLIPRGNEKNFVFFLHGKLLDDPID